MEGTAGVGISNEFALSLAKGKLQALKAAYDSLNNKGANIEYILESEDMKNGYGLSGRPYEKMTEDEKTYIKELIKTINGYIEDVVSELKTAISTQSSIVESLTTLVETEQREAQRRTNQ